MTSPSSIVTIRSEEKLFFFYKKEVGKKFRSGIIHHMLMLLWSTKTIVNANANACISNKM